MIKSVKAYSAMLSLVLLANLGEVVGKEMLNTPYWYTDRQAFE